MPRDTSIFILETLTPCTSTPSGLLLKNDRSNWPKNRGTSAYSFSEANNDAALSPLPLHISFSDQPQYSPEVMKKDYISCPSPEPSVAIPCKQNEKTTKLDIALNALDTLSVHHITLTDLLTSIISSDPEFIAYHYALFSEKNRSPLQNLFSLILKDEKGSHIM
jgi:hypothetical protein